MAEDVNAELERLRAENEDLKAKATKQRRLKVSEKGGVSIYGIRRFPITFYADEWDILLGMEAAIRKFIADNESGLKRR